MGPIPRGPLILCMGPKLGWPGGMKTVDMRTPDIFKNLKSSNTMLKSFMREEMGRFLTLWSCRVHIRQHGMWSWSATWWLGGRNTPREFIISSAVTHQIIHTSMLRRSVAVQTVHDVTMTSHLRFRNKASTSTTVFVLDLNRLLFF